MGGPHGLPHSGSASARFMCSSTSACDGLCLDRQSTEARSRSDTDGLSGGSLLRRTGVRDHGRRLAVGIGRLRSLQGETVGVVS